MIEPIDATLFFKSRNLCLNGLIIKSPYDDAFLSYIICENDAVREDVLLSDVFCPLLSI